MDNQLHKHYKTASHLMVAVFLLDPVEFFFSKYLGTTKDEIVFELLGLLFIALTAYAIRRGVTWVKYILLILTVFGIAAVVMFSQTPSLSVIPFVITCLQVVLMSWALVLLFRIPPVTNQEALDKDI